MRLHEIPTPALIIDKKIVMQNLQKMQEYAEKYKVNLRPHTKTHKMPYFAKLQENFGAKGITVAKVGEAEVMARNGLKDIFIANEIVGDEKFKTHKRRHKFKLWYRQHRASKFSAKCI